MAAGNDIKHWLKRAVKRAARIPGAVFRLYGTRILTYHNIAVRCHDMNVAPDQFQAQMQWLAANANVIPLGVAAQGENGVAITFDDGYRDNWVHAAPVLRALNLPATFFVVAGRVGETLGIGADAEPGRLMTWDELRDLAAQGFAIGSHTLTHRRLSSLSEDEQRSEIAESARRIQSQLGIPVEAFAYPFGSQADYDETSETLVCEAGYAYAVSNRYGVNGLGRDRWALRRIWIDATDDLETFAAKVTGRLDILTLLDSRTGLAIRRGINRLLRVQ